MKITYLVAGAAIVAATLAGCSGSDDDSKKSSSTAGASSTYCKDLKSVATDIKQLQAGEVSKFGTMVDKFPKLADEAPATVADDWKIFSQAFTDVEKAFSASGLELADLAAYQSGQKSLPKGVDVKKVQEAVKSYQAVTTDKVVKASKSIDVHAKKVCKVSLSAS
ncbi:MAG: hypothetical protein JWP31_937 [Aeromicrobium sp.]|nr:hypothetical protein [Aeromicrobium sp.]